MGDSSVYSPSSFSRADVHRVLTSIAHHIHLSSWKASYVNQPLHIHITTFSAHLTSPPCILNFPRTSNNTPGFPSTLQSGISTAAPVSVIWPISLAGFSSERIMEIPPAVKGECNDRCGDDGEGGFGRFKLLARVRVGGTGRIILP